MANTFARKVITSGPRYHKARYQITGDGSGDESGTLLIDIEQVGRHPDGQIPSELSLSRIEYTFSGFSADLEWEDSDGTNPLAYTMIGEEPTVMDFRDAKIRNDATNKTGSIDISTQGLGAGDKGTLMIECIKHYE